MTEEKASPGVRTRAVEIAVAALTLALGLLIGYESVQLGARWGEDGPQAGYFPFYISLIVCVCSILNLIGAVRMRSSAEASVFAEWDALRRVFAVLVPIALFIAGIYIVGIYVSTVIYIAVFMRWIGRYPWYRGFAVGFGVSFTLYMLFEVWFLVLLPKGAYNALEWVGL